MLAPESTFWVCLGKCAHWLLEIQDSRNRLSEWGAARYIMAVKTYNSSGCPIIRREAYM
jgi:hypothetical protein